MLHRQCRNLQGITVLSVSRLGKQSGMESIRPRKLLAALGSEQQQGSQNLIILMQPLSPCADGCRMSTCRNLQGITILSVSRLGKQSGVESIRPRKLLVTLGSEQQVHDVLQSVTRLCQLNKDRKASGWVSGVSSFHPGSEFSGYANACVSQGNWRKSSNKQNIWVFDIVICRYIWQHPCSAYAHVHAVHSTCQLSGHCPSVETIALVHRL